MSSPESSLPESWVEHIWTVMRATYGAAFDRLWQCPEGVDPTEHVRQLKAVWGRGLARFQQSKHALTWGLENLPERPPNLVEFRSLCMSVPLPSDAPPRLPNVTPNPHRVQAVLQGLEMRIDRSRVRHQRAWAIELKALEERGENLTQFQRDAWREALRTHLLPAGDAV